MVVLSFSRATVKTISNCVGPISRNASKERMSRRCRLFFSRYLPTKQNMSSYVGWLRKDMSLYVVVWFCHSNSSVNDSVTLYEGLFFSKTLLENRIGPCWPNNGTRKTKLWCFVFKRLVGPKQTWKPILVHLSVHCWEESQVNL